VSIVADVNADFSNRRIEDRVAEISGTKIEFLPEAWLAMRDMDLAKLAEVLAIRVDDGRRVVVDSR